ncbi:MAG: dihydropteroate synthase, partial [Flavobacteriales bacterium]
MQSLRTSHSIQLKGNLVSLDSPIIMGIMNLTPDSFYSESRASSDVAFAMAEQMFNDGASIIDLGGQSSRPGADLLSTEEELSRVLPIVEGLCSRFPDGAFSIDTFYSKVAKACVEAGAAMVNDISAGSMDDELLNTVANLNVPY